MYEKCFKDGSLLCSPMSPIDFFVPEIGSIVREESGKYGITIFVKPFFWDNENIETEIRLDFIDFNNKSFEELSCKDFSFPINPIEGYIDGSIYIENRHNPVDVLSICFGPTLSDLSDDHVGQNYIVSTMLYQFCWEGHSKLMYPEVRRLNTILEYREIDYEKIKQTKLDRIQRKLLQRKEKNTPK